MFNNTKVKFFFSPFFKIVIFVLIFLFLFSFFISSDFFITVNSVSTIEWSATLYFNEPGGENNYVLFGEASDASDGQDSYDIPSPPPGIPSYIRSWFNSGLNEPYDSLLNDIKKYPDDSKIWDFYVQWVPSDYVSSSNITISWDISDISTSEYEFVILYDYDNDIIITDMQIDNNYTYSSSAMIPYHYQIICNSSSTPSNNPPNQPSNPYPQDKAMTVNIITTVTWTGGDSDEGDIVTYVVYFGKIPNPPIVSINQSSESYNPGTLSYSTKYYWKIIAWDNHGLSTEGSIWQFTTESQLPPPQNKPPIADTNGPYQGYVNQTITFDASNSYDTDGVIKYYRWDFTNDGKWDTDWIEETTITNVYPNAGNFQLKLQVKDDFGATNSVISQVTILSKDKDKKIPIADANGPYLGIINQSIAFDASGSYDIDGIIVSYTWDFGDGIKNNDIKATHIYTTQGIYTVSLLVVDNDGLTNVDKTTAYISYLDSDGDGWGDDEENKYGSDPNDSEDYPLDTDNDHIPDSEDEDDDNDGLSDDLEEKLGSNPKEKSDVLSFNVNGITHFLIDTNKDGISDLFYNTRSGKSTKVDYKGNNQYLIDEDGDGKWDYLFETSYGTITPYKEEEFSFPLLPLLAIISIGLILLIIIVIKIFYKKS